LRWNSKRLSAMRTASVLPYQSAGIAKQFAHLQIAVAAAALVPVGLAIAVGALVGATVGTLVGAVVGAMVGAIVGTGVGAGAGLHALNNIAINTTIHSRRTKSE
jgi:uncharacterized membrane protein